MYNFLRVTTEYILYLNIYMIFRESFNDTHTPNTHLRIYFSPSSTTSTPTTYLLSSFSSSLSPFIDAVKCGWEIPLRLNKKKNEEYFKKGFYDSCKFEVWEGLTSSTSVSHFCYL
jgi:hypothetical protein